ncbi:hypothetical protein ASF53_06040 [Methylobacterium sp. Leaf123]|uniref:hypothetical protein n=1 Tax=Methylobacterium sp. Leaf123 TaxID=1736264 RepID=UPI0006F6B6DF|nr:hypothetical protein [Methylobacterium sp. Leaf123]KQQ23866.1 hypothetical protein ASF53_06040 [Methylobacterium sp. Leaf123]
MRHLLPLVAVGLAITPAYAEADEHHRRLAPRPTVTTLPPDMPYRDPRPRFRAAPPGERFAVRAYVPRSTNQPMFNEPPQPLR